MYKISKMVLKCLLLFMTVLFILMNNEPLIARADDGHINSNEDEIISSININEEFDDKSIIVVLKPNTSQYYGIRPEFAEKLCSVEEVESYEDLSELSIESLVNDGIDPKYYSSIEEHLDSIEFKQILKINLNTTSKQEVLNGY